MPRKPKVEKKTVNIRVNDALVSVILHPPAGKRTSWYAYWAGIGNPKSTGQVDLTEAIKVAEAMLRNGGARTTADNAILSEEELDTIQHAHFVGKRTAPRGRSRGEKTLKAFREALAAFKDIVAMEPIRFTRPATLATADVCAAFQIKALTLPKNWRRKHPKSRKAEEVGKVSPNTVLKWSRALQAAWQRANTRAGKKCVRGVVDSGKLLSGNPWNDFPWIEGVEKPVRQFNTAELLGFLDYLDREWPGFTVGAALAKVYLWSACRQEEVTTLRWDQHREVEGQHHFHIVGKRNVERWFRVPAGLHEELESLRTDSPFVFAAYNGQLRRFHEANGRPDNARRVGEEFKPLCLGDWLYDRLGDWSATLPGGHAHPHVFRKTALQQAWVGDESMDKRVAEDACVGKEVMLAHYVRVLRERSNRTYCRILSALPPEVAYHYGHVQQRPLLKEQLRQAVEAEDWDAVDRLRGELAGRQEPPAA
jgi:integrase